jgi:transcriptional regulator with XRE-family HTH domain
MLETDALVELSRARALVSDSARSIRVKAGLTLKEVAEALGVAEATVYRWENGQRRPRGDAALRYASLLETLRSRRARR